MTHAARNLIEGAVLALACALLSGCYLAHERDTPDAAVDASSACIVAPIDGCEGWEAAGPLTILSEPLRPDENLRYGSAIVRDCGVLAAWSIATTRPSGTSVRYETRAADWSGAPVAAIVPHPSITREDSSAAPPLLARGPGGAGALVATGGACLFVPLDLDGRERGMPVRAAMAEGCGGLVGTPLGYSFIATQDSATPRFALCSVDAAGTMPSVVMLPAMPGRILWSRTAFDDGSFLTSSFSQDFVTSRYTSWLQHFDERGLELAPEVELGENGAVVLASPTTDGALTAWMTAASGGLPLRVRPVDRDGRATGDTRDAPAEGALYGFAIAPTPDGDAVFAWVESHWRATPEWRLRVIALGPDGAPRGAPTTVLTDINAISMQILVEPSGGRALLVFGDEAGVRAQPLTCVR